ncbi:N-acyl homoserine lactonase family protein [Gemmatimonas sp.]|uniref:N-acyl homoserine lactonase family protein n=1 Tax=Gemmatimonas sp. TaxID=1962908 RepID=UPI003569A317
MPLELIPLDLGHITNVQCAAHKYFQGFGETTSAQMIVWLIKGGPFPVIVDFGPGDPATVKERFGRDYVQTPEQTLQVAMAAAGVDPASVGAVVLTHLHWDHALGMESNPFPNALIYLQREEARYAATPYSPHNGLYEPHLLRKLLPTHATEFENLRLIEGDFTLFDGVTVLFAPGHTPGSQAVLVETGEVTYILAGDNVPFADSWQGLTQSEWIPSGTHVSVTDIYATLGRFAQLADVVLPSHDAVVLEWAPFPSGGPTYRAGGSSSAVPPDRRRG